MSDKLTVGTIEEWRAYWMDGRLDDVDPQGQKNNAEINAICAAKEQKRG